MDEDRRAFVLRIAPSGVDRVNEALREGVAIIGWSRAHELLDSPDLAWRAFREVLRTKYYAEDTDLRRAGTAAGHMWRFIREMKPDDLVERHAVPSSS